MTPDEITNLISHQIAGAGPLANSHNIDLDQCLLTPVQMEVIARAVHGGELKDSSELVWLVLEENPVTRDGYKIVFSERRKTFGLAVGGYVTDRFPILIGWYGDFPTTLAMM